MKIRTMNFCYAAAIMLLAGCVKKEITTTENTDAAAAKLKTDAAGVHVTKTNLFSNANTGQTMYHSYFGPSIVFCTKTHTIVAFAEAKISNPNDGSMSNIVSQRSFNNGVDWASFQTIIGDGTVNYGNPTSVYDPNMGGAEGRIWLFVTRAGNSVHAYYNDHSAAPGTAWTEVSNTNMYTPGSSFTGVGPGAGIVMRANPTWIVIPAQDRNIVSKNSGATWQMVPTNNPQRSNEATIFEGDDGLLHRNDRPKGGLDADGGTWDQHKYRVIAQSVSSDPAAAWTANFTWDTHLPDPKCEGSILYYSSANVVFCNSADMASRYYMKVRVSHDDGTSWSAGRYLYSAGASGKGGYTSMARVDDFSIGLLCNTASDPSNLSSTSNHWRIDFHRIDLPWINGM